MTTAVPKNWPNRDLSNIVHGPVHQWHVQRAGEGRKILLLHGAGASVHSFRSILLPLAKTNNVLAVDLPGHGFTRLGARRRSGLREMAEDITALCQKLQFDPDLVVGHSAGAAITLQMAGAFPNARVIGLNAALGHFDGVAGVIFPAMAKLLAATPFAAKLFSTTASNPKKIAALLESTGSKLDDVGISLYRDLVSRESHVNGALAMMAQWTLGPLLANLSAIPNPCHLIVGTADKTVPPKVSQKASRQLPDCTFVEIEGLGHLMHEEEPDRFARLILQHA